MMIGVVFDKVPLRRAKCAAKDAAEVFAVAVRQGVLFKVAFAGADAFAVPVVALFRLLIFERASCLFRGVRLARLFRSIAGGHTVKTHITGASSARAVDVTVKKGGGRMRTGNWPAMHIL